MLGDTHNRKFGTADEIYAINDANYNDFSNMPEVEYAIATRKSMKYLIEPQK